MFKPKDPSLSQLPANVLAALEEGRTIEAIKLLRRATDLGLKEAKDAVDAHLSGQTVDLAQAIPVLSLPPEVTAAMQQGHKVEAVRLLRENTGLGLGEAKDAVEALHGPGHPAANQPLSPGQVGKAVHGSKAWVVLLVIVALGYVLFSRAGS